MAVTSLTLDDLNVDGRLDIIVGDVALHYGNSTLGNVLETGIGTS